MIPTIGTKISGYFFSLIFPFAAQATIVTDFSLMAVARVLISLFLESFIVYRMLKKPCKFVIPRMFVINLVAILAESVVFAALTVIFWIFMLFYGAATFPAIVALPKNMKDFSPEQFETVIAYPLALFGLIGGIILFYVRFKVFCKMYAWFDKSVNQVALRKTMLYAVSASYFFWVVVMVVERIFKLNL